MDSISTSGTVTPNPVSTFLCGQTHIASFRNFSTYCFRLGGFVPVYYSLLFFDGWYPSAVFSFSPNLELVIGGTRVGWGDGNEGEGEGKEEGCGEGAFKDSIGGVDGEERFGVEISSVEFEDEQFVVTEEE